jgi:hypothetical protein
MCGHMGQAEAREICDYYGQAISKSGFQQCVNCGRAKAKQLLVTQDNKEHVVAGPEEHRIFIDISSVKHGKEKKKLVSKPYWMVMVVEMLNFKISEFLHQKKELPEKACQAIRDLKQKGINVKYVRLDNAGENVAFSQLANGKEWNMQLTFEFTGARTLQQNYLVEVGFATLWGRLRAVFDAAMVPEEEKYKLIREGIHHLTFLDRLIIKEVQGEKKTKYGHLHSEDQRVTMPMRTWGEGGIIKVADKIKSKLQLRVEAPMFVGFAKNSAQDTYHMYDPANNSIHETRDVQWSKRMFFEPEKGQQIQAEDLVDMVVDKRKVPLRTNAKPAIQERNKGQGFKGRVRFRDQVEHIEENQSEEDWEDEDLSSEGWISTRVIEVDPAQEEEMSTISSSLGKTVWPKGRTCMLNVEVEENSESVAGSNYYSSLDQWSNDEEEEDDDRIEEVVGKMKVKRARMRVRRRAKLTVKSMKRMKGPCMKMMMRSSRDLRK